VPVPLLYVNDVAPADTVMEWPDMHVPVHGPVDEVLPAPEQVAAVLSSTFAYSVNEQSALARKSPSAPRQAALSDGRSRVLKVVERMSAGTDGAAYSLFAYLHLVAIHATAAVPQPPPLTPHPSKSRPVAVLPQLFSVPLCAEPAVFPLYPSLSAQFVA